MLSKVDFSEILSPFFQHEIPKEESHAYFYSNQSFGGLQKVYLQALNSAEKSILVLIFALNDSSIIDTLKKKASRGVNVTVICDAEASKDVGNRLGPNIKVYYQNGAGIMHLKLLVIDLDQVYVGSANFTRQSLKKNGNLVVGFNSPVIANTIQQLANSLINPSLKEPSSAMVGFLQQKIELWFLPAAGKTAFHRLMNLLYQAKTSVRIAMYTLTHPQLVEAIIDAKDRGIVVEVVLDRNQALNQRNDVYQQLVDAGIKVGLSNSDDLLHYKMAWIDERILVTGSANWTLSAFYKNNDCFLVIDPLDSAQSADIKKVWTSIFSNAAYKPVYAMLIDILQ